MSEKYPRCPKCNARIKFDWEEVTLMVQVIEKGKIKYFPCNETMVLIAYFDGEEVMQNDKQFILTCNCDQVLGTSQDGEFFLIPTLIDYDWTDILHRTDEP